MLFDLRSRGRRRTMQVIYIGLAVLMGGGLILFGVGTGSGGGGLLGAFTGKGSNQQSSVGSSQAKAAQQQVQLHPDSAGAWGRLVLARSEAASSGGYDSSTSSYTPAGKQQLTLAIQAWKRYQTLTPKPSADVGTIAAHAYGALGEYSGEADAWQAVTSVSGAVNGYECLALSAYAAKEDRVGDLAKAKALTKIAKAQRKTVAAQLEAAKTQPSEAASC